MDPQCISACEVCSPWTGEGAYPAVIEMTSDKHLMSTIVDIMSTTATFTNLLRHPSDVVAQTSHGAVRITRRDAEDLILMRAGELEQQEAGIALASQLIRAMFRHTGDMLAALHDLFPWIDLLSEDEKRACAKELASRVTSAVELGEYRLLLDDFRSWKSTAGAYAAGMPRNDDDLTWLPDLPVVLRPE